MNQYDMLETAFRNGFAFGRASRTKDNRPTYTAALEKFGWKMQATVCVEELSELQKELCKYIRSGGDPDHIAEEIADVLITVDQMVQLFDCAEAVARWEEAKVERLAERCAETEGANG
jgi:NTP pyrophosphatase (non-canonical NTP hydrolase)